MVEDKFDNLIDNNKVMDKDFIDYLIFNYLKDNGLLSYVQAIKYDDNSETEYDFRNQIIILNYEQIFSFSKDVYLYQEFINNKRFTNYILNSEMLFYIFHELTHVKQASIINNNKNTLLKNVYYRSIINSLNNLDLYKNYHDLFLIEYNANVNALLEKYNFINKTNSYLMYNSYVLYDYINDGYKNYNSYINSPVEEELLLLSYEPCYEEIINDKEYKKMSSFTKIKNGLPIDKETYKKIDTIQITNPIKIKQLFNDKK